MADYGIKISKPTYDAGEAGDADLLFSSAWPSLPIVKQATVAAGVEEYEHNLGFPPLFSVWQKAYQPLFPDYSEAVADGWTRIGTLYGNVSCDENKIYFPAGTDLTHIKVYNVNLTQERDYGYVPGSAIRGSYDPNFGIKIAKEGEDVDSSDLRDFILHSRAQSPLILSVKTATENATGGTATYTDPQGYVSWVFGFVRNATTGRWTMIPYFSQSYPELSITNTDSNAVYTAEYVSAFGDDNSALVVLRDPMFAAVDIEVSY